MKTFVKTFRGKISHEKIDTYVNLVLKTLDPDDYYDLEFQQDDGWQFIRIEVWANRDADNRYVTVNILDKVLH